MKKNYLVYEYNFESGLVENIYILVAYKEDANKIKERKFEISNAEAEDLITDCSLRVYVR